MPKYTAYGAMRTPYDPDLVTEIVEGLSAALDRHLGPTEIEDPALHALRTRGDLLIRTIESTLPDNIHNFESVRLLEKALIEDELDYLRVLGIVMTGREVEGYALASAIMNALPWHRALAITIALRPPADTRTTNPPT